MRNIKKRPAFWRGKTGALRPKPTRNPPPDRVKPGDKMQAGPNAKNKIHRPKIQTVFSAIYPARAGNGGNPGPGPGPEKRIFCRNGEGRSHFLQNAYPICGAGNKLAMILPYRGKNGVLY